MLSKVEMPFDVLSFWYNSAKECVARYNPDTMVHPRDDEYSRKRERGYQMALKTVEILESIMETVEITKEENGTDE